MSQLIGLLNRAKYFFLFILLELLSFALIRKNNLKWDVTMFNSTNAMTGKAMAATQGAKEYLNLKVENANLVNENKAILARLSVLEAEKARPDAFFKTDSLFSNRFDFKVAKVINSTTALANNYITIDKGSEDGISSGMAVIGPHGVVGQVMSCSSHFSRVFSVLHKEFRISSEVVNADLRKGNQYALGLSLWDGISSRRVNLGTIDKFKPVAVSDSVITSAQNLVFPPGVLIGKISKVETPPNTAFHQIEVELATDFRGLTYVYVVDNKMKEEQLKLETDNE
ncbi:MAG: rod shape-determining protein MreC [Arcticibacterium sp.]|jgi:rod shape-determining protein MreC